MVEKNEIPEHFDVSSGLKSVLGRELITDDEVAIFELVKNSFDAEASRVDLHFSKDSIVVADNGQGMTAKEVKEKWLTVAYSAKRPQNDFRDDIAAKRKYAGSKGIGRISTDRLGKNIVLQTRSRDEKSKTVKSISVDWSLFDRDHKKRFENIPTKNLPDSNEFDLPKELSQRDSGTVVSITNLYQVWDRDKLIRLKSDLSKLINPFGSKTDNFDIVLRVPSEDGQDKQIAAKYQKLSEEVEPTEIVNGSVGNFIFGTLESKTTHLKVKISDDGKFISSELKDRGELIYEIREPNQYKLLSNAEFSAHIFFLNKSAKITFARRMGVPSYHFGSIFLFRNSFRVFPIGQTNDDWFGMDRRKGQGYARYLGTRDLIGRIDVSGSDEMFSEASSRNTGLIENEATMQLKTAFLENCLKRLEGYVVPVTFKDLEDKNVSDISRIKTDPGRERVTNVVSKLVNSKDIELLNYSKNLINLLDERSSRFESSLIGLRSIAEKTQDKKLFGNIEEAEKRFRELKASEEKARIQAEKESEARKVAELRAAEAQVKTQKTEAALEEEKKRNLFLTSSAALDKETIQELHHQVRMYSIDIHQQLENTIVEIKEADEVSKEDVLDALESITLLNSRIMSVATFATKANFRLASEHINENIAEYIGQYLAVAEEFQLGSIAIETIHNGDGFKKEFKPIDVAIIIDNLIANAKKAKANKISFQFSYPEKNILHLLVNDNGRGLNDDILDADRIFEKGYTTTDGSGLGLYHVSHVLGEMNGTIELVSHEDQRRSGVEFLIRITK